MRRILPSLILWTFAVGPALAQNGLAVGDAVPDLPKLKWVKGDAFEPAKGNTTDVYVVVLWSFQDNRASGWVAARLSELQPALASRGLRTVAICPDSEKKVRDFLTAVGPGKSAFAFAVDLQDRVYEKWVAAVGHDERPRAFIIKAGKVIWTGNPYWPFGEFDAKLAETCGDAEYAKRLKDYADLWSRFQKQYGDEKWDDALKSLDQLQTIRPSDTTLYWKCLILASQKKDAAATLKVGREFVKMSDDSNMLNEFSWSMLTDESWKETRDLPLATEAATKALQLTRAEEPHIVDTYARALYESGDVAGAIEWQQRAVEVCRKHQVVQIQAELESTLTNYRKRAHQGY